MTRNRETRFPFPAAFAAVAAFVVALFVLYVLVKNNYEVIERGRLLPYTSAEIYRIKLFDRVTIYAEPEDQTSLDIVDSWILVSISSVALLALLFLWSAHLAARAHAATFFFVTWLGTGFLAVDEIVGGHENLGHNLRFLRNLPGIDRPDDAVIVFYIVPTLAFLIAFRRIILGSRTARVFFGLGTAIFVVAALADAGGVAGQDEERIEVVASLSFLVGFMTLTVDELRRATDDAPV